jgi:hypothetical protein
MSRQQIRPEGLRLRADRLGGTDGNEVLTSAAAVVLILLLAAEGVTILNVRGLRGPHMFIGMVLIPPVLVKLGSTGYRFARYYARAPAYREKGPPLLPLRLLAPILVAATLVVFATGVALLIVGHRSGLLLQLHKVSFIVWAATFAVHFLVYLPRVARSLTSDWTAARRREVPGSHVRLVLLIGSISAGIVLALSVLSSITGWHGEQSF